MVIRNGPAGEALMCPGWDGSARAHRHGDSVRRRGSGMNALEEKWSSPKRFEWTDAWTSGRMDECRARFPPDGPPGWDLSDTGGATGRDGYATVEAFVRVIGVPLTGSISISVPNLRSASRL